MEKIKAKARLVREGFCINNMTKILDKSDLAKLTTKEICEKYNCDKTSVSHMRKKHGVSATDKNLVGKYVWEVKENVDMLGKFTDTDIAKILGLSICAVQQARTRRGIKRFCKSTKNPNGAGRKPKPELEKIQITKIMLSRELMEKFIALGGSKWLSQTLRDIK
jgi:ribosomal protein L5